MSYWSNVTSKRETANAFVKATLSRLMTYALGRELDYLDQPAIRQIMRETEAKGYRFADLIGGVVKSVPFQMRQTQDTQKGAS